MVLWHLPRTVANVAHGLSRRQPAHAAKSKPVGIQTPHTYTARTNPLTDVDLFGHMNNAAYLVHAEMARWNLTAELGLLSYVARRRLAFLVVHNAVLYRRPIGPLERFTISTQLADWGAREAVFLHTFRDGRERLAAQVVCRAVFREMSGSHAFVAPASILADSIGYDASTPPASQPFAAVLKASSALNTEMRAQE